MNDEIRKEDHTHLIQARVWALLISIVIILSASITSMAAFNRGHVDKQIENLTESVTELRIASQHLTDQTELLRHGVLLNTKTQQAQNVKMSEIVVQMNRIASSNHQQKGSQ